jgi:hypothetical protein
MSQLTLAFKAAIDAFNACHNAGDYSGLQRYMDPNAKMKEVDPPHKEHHTSANVIAYLCEKQPPFLPRFSPDYNKLKETPQDSDNATSASVDGPATYQDCSTGNANGNPDPISVTLHYEFTRPDTHSPWLITLASAK